MAERIPVASYLGMCTQYQIKADLKDIGSALEAPVINASGKSKWDLIVAPTNSAPVLRATSQGIEVVELVFPISPFPNSRLSGFERQTDGKDTAEIDEEHRQIKRIYDLPTWKAGFAKFPYLIPMTGFTEYAYWGENAGSALRFQIPKQEIFFAAGIAVKGFTPKSGKVDAFSILTHTATEQMLEYHHRLIVLLTPHHALQYLDEMAPEERFRFLIQNRYLGHLNVSKIRDMTKGWEKRAVDQTKKLDREQLYRQTLNKEHIAG